VPTPVGHALGALLVTAPLRARYRLMGAGVALAAAAAGVAPDLDLLVGRHSAETHSIGGAAIAGLATWAFLRWRHVARARVWGCLVAAAVLSHTLLDWLGTDTSAPIGIMALWPFSREFFESGAHVFQAVSRRYWLEEFWIYNLGVLGRELLLLGLPALLVEFVLRRRRAGEPRPH
jgi:inner membrane protein